MIAKIKTHFKHQAIRDQNFLHSFIKHIKTNKKTIIWNYVIFFLIFEIFLALDQITKATLFVHGDIHQGIIGTDGRLQVTIINPDGKEEMLLAEQINPYSYQNFLPFLGIRSIWHGGVTFLPDSVPSWVIQLISIIIFIITLVIPLYTQKRNRFLIVFVALLGAGDLGNALDRFLFNGHVKDILYVINPSTAKQPDTKLGGSTFNVADLTIFLGIILSVISSVVIIVRDWREENKQEKQEQIEETKIISQLKAQEKVLDLVSKVHFNNKRRTQKILKSRRMKNINRRKK